MAFLHNQGALNVAVVKPGQLDGRAVDPGPMLKKRIFSGVSQIKDGVKHSAAGHAAHVKNAMEDEVAASATATTAQGNGDAPNPP
eukprot:CAMPEP_0115728298 /NCGR_PEP_ID=MMETSP0272-20121206/82900_1 /TAXON_ID=71861 /ORGANISM="Scrippsiella trochoidea, Strain CCMP3099" /LENGTH=84 /DNA_ID=CAMNT_0003171905 /DNA_START=904 /DNA_END=1155 /DNA_ORIENTATION=-